MVGLESSDLERSVEDRLFSPYILAPRSEWGSFTDMAVCGGVHSRLPLLLFGSVDVRIGYLSCFCECQWGGGYPQGGGVIST